MTIAILTQFVRQSTIEMEAEEIKYDLYASRVVGQKGAQAACTYVNIPGLHQRLRSADTTHVFVSLAIIGCFMLFKIS